MTAIEALRLHLKAIEDSDYMTPPMIERYRKALKQVEAMQLPVERIEDVKLRHWFGYSIYVDGSWLHGHGWDEHKKQFVTSADDANPINADDVSFVVMETDIDDALNAAIEEVGK